MPDFFVNNNFYQKTFDATVPQEQRSIYQPRGVFSITADNKLRATLWIIKDGVRLLSGIGSASYEIFNSQGVSMGISENNITPDVNGFYITSEVSAAAIQDLEHYTVKVSIAADSEERVNILAITLGQ